MNKLKSTLFIGSFVLLSSNMLWSQSQNALKFDGVNDYVSFSNLAAGNLGTSNFTVEFLVKYQQAPAQTACVVSKRLTCNDEVFWNVLILPSGAFAFELSNGLSGGYAYWESSVNIINCDWTHIAVVRVGPSYGFYMNGTIIGGFQPISTIDLTNTAELLLGKSPCSNTFAGTIDNFRIWNTNRSQTEIMNNTTTEMTGNEANLILNCNFNQGVANANNTSETTLDDSSPSNFDGTLNNFALNGFNSNWVDATIPISTIDVQTACGPYTWIDGNTYTASNNSATILATNSAGCDSIIQLNLTINNPTSTTDVQTACGPYTWIDGNTYTQSNNSATYLTTASTGCDSTVTLNLTLFDLQEQTVTATEPTIYCPNSTTINIQNSELEVQYVLLDNLQDTIVSGPTVGTGGPLSFNTGTITSTMDYAVEAKYGYSTGGIVFNGGDEKIVVPADPAFEFTTGTLETWIKPAAGAGFPEMFLTMRSAYNSSRYSFHISENANVIGLWTGTWTTVSYPFNVGTWYHIALRIFPTTTEVYVNGEYVGDLGAIGSTTGESFVIGSSNDPGYPDERLHGEMDNVRVWNTTRTPAEISQNMDMCLTGNEPGLVALYKLDDVAGSSVALDATGNHNGVLDPTMDPATDWVNGVGCYTCRALMSSTATVVLNQINTATTTSEETISADQTGATYQWIDCTNGNTAISGATNQSFTATANGDYAVIVTINGCSDTSACESITTVGLEDALVESMLIISPNPSNGSFTIESNLLQSASLVSVFSTEGKVMYQNANVSGQSIELNAINWETGVYFLTLETDQQKMTRKLIKY